MRSRSCWKIGRTSSSGSGRLRPRLVLLFWAWGERIFSSSASSCSRTVMCFFLALRCRTAVPLFLFLIGFFLVAFAKSASFVWAKSRQRAGEHLATSSADLYFAHGALDWDSRKRERIDGHEGKANHSGHGARSGAHARTARRRKGIR